MNTFQKITAALSTCALVLVLSAGCIAGIDHPFSVVNATSPQGTTTITPALPSIKTPSASSANIPVPDDIRDPSSQDLNVAPTIMVNLSMNGGILRVKAGQRVMIRLPEDPTTGYTWNAAVPKGLDLLNERYGPLETGHIGNGGYHDWIVVPMDNGTYVFNAVYFHPWENHLPTDESYSLVIVAKW